MGSREKESQTVTHKIQTGGEVTVNLVLTIKLDNEGLSVSSAEALPASSKKLMKEQINETYSDNDKVDWIIPDIESEGIIQFGKKVED